VVIKFGPLTWLQMGVLDSYMFRGYVFDVTEWFRITLNGLGLLRIVGNRLLAIK
jgi:hypothetical protein